VVHLAIRQGVTCIFVFATNDHKRKSHPLNGLKALLVTNLFLIDGASGTGKSDLIEYVRSHKRCGVLVKATTRDLRDYEENEGVALDLSFHSREEFDSFDLEYKYEYGEENYGFSKGQLDECLDRFENVFAIIRSVSLMRELKKDYENYKVIAVYVHSDLRLIEERMRCQGRTQAEIDFRVSRISATFLDYVKNRDFFDQVIDNTSDKLDYYTLIDDLIKKYHTLER
jgi:guanylate kinase